MGVENQAAIVADIKVLHVKSAELSPLAPLEFIQRDMQIGTVEKGILVV